MLIFSIILMHLIHYWPHSLKFYLIWSNIITLSMQQNIRTVDREVKMDHWLNIWAISKYRHHIFYVPTYSKKSKKTYFNIYQQLLTFSPFRLSMCLNSDLFFTYHTSQTSVKIAFNCEKSLLLQIKSSQHFDSGKYHFRIIVTLYCSGKRLEDTSPSFIRGLSTGKHWRVLTMKWLSE